MFFPQHSLKVILLSFGLTMLVSCSSVEPALAPELEAQGSERVYPHPQSELEKIAQFYAGDGFRNCITTPFDVPGQGLHAAGSGLHAAGSGLHAAGSVGGLFISKPNTLVQTYTPQNVSNYLESFSDYTATENVGIIVLDQFSYETKPGKRSTAYAVGSDVYDLVEAAQSGQAALEDTFYDLRKTGQLSHGALVFEHAQEVLEGLPGITPSWYNEFKNSTSQKVYYRDGKKIVVRAVDVTDLDTDDIASNLESAIATLREQGVSKYSVNMSFSIVPCALSELAREYGTIEDYLENIEAEAAAAGEEFDADEFMSFMSWTTARTDDPLLRVIRETYYPPANPAHGNNPINVNRDRIAFVAAAGNFGGNLPLLPALADDVISVSSFDLPTYDLSSFSNSGGVSAPGWVFRLDDSTDGRAISYAGTSFSSPAVAVYAALDLAQTSPHCFASNEPSDLLSYETWDNKELDAAVSDCTP